MLRDRIPHLIEVAIDEAISFSCNAVVVGKTVILNDGAPKLAAGPGGAGLQCSPAGFLRVHQIGRKRQVPDVSC